MTRAATTERTLGYTAVVLLLISVAKSLAADLEVKFFDVGQADAVLVTCPDGKHRLLIDSADTRYPGSSIAFKTSMTNEFEGRSRTITVAVSSHPHSDHIGNMEWVLQNFEVRTYIDNGQRYDSAMFGRLDATRRKLVRAGKLNYVNGKESSFKRIEFCTDPKVRLELIVPWAVKELDDPNDRSVAVRLTYDNKTLLFVGDIEGHGEAVALNNFRPEDRDKLDVDLLKVGHHGSDTSSTAAFINAVSPHVAIISCGKKGVGTNVGYKHPRVSTLGQFRDWFKNHRPTNPAPPRNVWAYEATTKQWRIENRPEGVWITAIDGTVVVRCNGQKFEVTGQDN
jgi:competence protein ComEC